MERSNTEGAQFRNLYDETRTANAGTAPEVTHLRAREALLITEVSTLPNRETELPGQLLTPCQEHAHVNARVNQSQITNDSMNIRNQELTQQLQTSNIEIFHLQAEASGLRHSVGRSQSAEHREAENLRNVRGYHISTSRENRRRSTEIERLPLSL